MAKIIKYFHSYEKKNTVLIAYFCHMLFMKRITKVKKKLSDI